MKHFDAFAGIGGFTKSLMDVFGHHYENVGFSEIDKHAAANYLYNFPNHKNYGDIKLIQPNDLPDFDIFTGGFPCQSFSMAGKRRGFEDARGTLFFEIARICSIKKPRYILLENVKGLLNHDGGRTVATIFRVLADIGYTVEWQLVNTKWVLPQNRERIYIIGHLATDAQSAKYVFPIGENGGLFEQSENSNERWAQTKYSASTLGASGSMRGTDTFIEVPQIAGTLTGGGNSGGLHSDMTTIKVGAMRGRGEGWEQTLEINESGTPNALTSVQKDNLVIGTWRTHKDGEGFRKVSDDNCSTIPARARQDGSGQPVIITHYGHLDKEPKISEISPTLKAESHGHEPMTNIGSNIRRLTEIECERLQGYEDNYTKYGNYDGKIKEIPKTQRYKMLGNSVTKTIVDLITSKIEM